MSDEESRKEADRLLGTLRTFEVPANLEAQVIKRLRQAESDRSSLRGRFFWLLPVLLTCGLASFILGDFLMRQASSNSGAVATTEPPSLSHFEYSQKQDRTAKTPLEQVIPLGQKKPPEVSDASASLRSRSVNPTRDRSLDHAKSAIPSPATQGGTFVNWSFRAPNGYNSVRNIAVQGTVQRRGDHLPGMTTIHTPGEPLPKLLLAAAPGTALPSFTQALGDGDQP